MATLTQNDMSEAAFDRICAIAGTLHDNPFDMDQVVLDYGDGKYHVTVMGDVYTEGGGQEYAGSYSIEVDDDLNPIPGAVWVKTT